MTELALLANDPTSLDAKADPVLYVVLACERAKAWLTDALEHGDIEAIVETKSQAEAIRVYTAQKQLGHDAETAAREVVRRAERGIGVAIRRGQEAGTIETPVEAARRAAMHREVNQGRRDRLDVAEAMSKPRPTDYAAPDELSDIYAVTDGVTDTAFEASIDEAKAEGNLSRANVVRKVNGQQAANSKLSRKQKADRLAELAGQGYSSRQMLDQLGYTRVSEISALAREYGIEIPADKSIARTRRHDSNRIAAETINALAGLAIGVDLINYEDLDVAQVGHWATSLDESLKVLNQFRKKLKKVTE